MRRIVSLLAALSLCVSLASAQVPMTGAGLGAPGGASCVFPSANLVSYWRFDEDTGTSTADQTGNGNTGTLTNSPTWGLGKINYAVVYGGGTQYVGVSSTSNFNFSNSSFSVSMWVKLASSQATYAGLLASGNSSNVAWTFQRDSSSTQIAAYLPNKVDFKSGSWTAITDNTWHHVVFILNFSLTVGTVQMYLDGSLYDTQTDLNNPGNFTVPFIIGGTKDATSVGVSGTIDELGIWKVGLSSTNVTALYNSGNGCQY